MTWLLIFLTFLFGCACGALALAYVWRRLMRRKEFFGSYLEGMIQRRRKEWIAAGLCGECGEQHVHVIPYSGGRFEYNHEAN